MSKKLTDLDFCQAAKRLRCDVAAIQAVDNTESRGSGFYADGFPTILFERHKFHKYTNGRFDASHPEISNSKSGGYGAAGANQRRKFNLAFGLDQKAAMMSCSWGRYQIMGFNYAVCGFSSIDNFIDAMKESEGAQLLAFCEFVEANNIDDELRNHNWDGFAYRYNGADYKKNNYAPKLASAHKKFAAFPINCNAAKPHIESDLSQPVEEVTYPIIEPTNQIENHDETTAAPAEVAPTETAEVRNQLPQVETLTQTVTVLAPPKENTTATTAVMTIGGFVVPSFLVGIITALRNAISDGFIDAKSVGDAILGFIENNSKYLFLVILAFIALMGVKKLSKQITLWLQMHFASRKDLNNVEVKPQ
jgi:N-acetylmuramidase